MNRQRTVLAALIGSLIACAQFAVATAEPRQAADPRVADLVRADLARAGKVRVGLFLPQFIKDPATGQLRSVWVETARAFAAHLGVQLVVVEYVTPPEAIACLKAGACDVMFLPLDARAAAVGDFSNPIFQFDYTLLVPAGSSWHQRASRFWTFRTGCQERGCWRTVTVRTSTGWWFPKGKADWLAYVSEFVENAKATGLVQKAIERGGTRGVTPAPAGNAN